MRRPAVVCFIPTGADPQAYLDALEANPGQPPQVDGGPPHRIDNIDRGVVAEVVGPGGRYPGRDDIITIDELLGRWTNPSTTRPTSATMSPNPANRQA